MATTKNGRDRLADCCRQVHWPGVGAEIQVRRFNETYQRPEFVITTEPKAGLGHVGCSPPGFGFLGPRTADKNAETSTAKGICGRSDRVSADGLQTCAGRTGRHDQHEPPAVETLFTQNSAGGYPILLQHADARRLTPNIHAQALRGQFGVLIKLPLACVNLHKTIPDWIADCDTAFHGESASVIEARFSDCVTDGWELRQQGPQHSFKRGSRVRRKQQEVRRGLSNPKRQFRHLSPLIRPEQIRMQVGGQTRHTALEPPEECLVYGPDNHRQLNADTRQCPEEWLAQNQIAKRVKTNSDAPALWLICAKQVRKCHLPLLNSQRIDAPSSYTIRSIVIGSCATP